MAVLSPCGKISKGVDLSCDRPSGRYYQQVVVINYDDIDPDTVVAPWSETPSDCGTVEFALKTGTTGYAFKFPEKGGGIFPTVDYSTDERGYVIFKHLMNMFITAKTPEEKCSLEGLLKGRVVVAAQYLSGGDKSVEILGLQNGLVAEDGTLDPHNNGGVSAIVLASQENGEEGYLPLIYTSTDPVADFDDAFSAVGGGA